MFCAIIVVLSAVRNSAYSRLNHYSFRNADFRGILINVSIVSFADASALRRSNISSLSLLAKVPSLEEYLSFWSAIVGMTYPLDIPLYTQLYKDSVENSKRYNPDCITHQLGAIAVARFSFNQPSYSSSLRYSRSFNS